MRYVSHLRLSVTATFAVAMLLVLAFGVQLTLAQDPEAEGPELPEPGSEDAPGDIGYGVERPAVQGEQEDCEIDPGDPRCPPPAPHSIATPVVSFPTIIANLKASYKVIVWGPTRQHSYKFELHRSTTATGTFRLNRSTWDGNREVDFYGVQRGYFYKLRAKRCRVWRSESDCGDWSRFSPSVYVPRPATALVLSRIQDRLTATYTATGKSWDKIVIANKAIGAAGNGTVVESDINGSGHNWTATRGKEYRFRVERCTTSTRSGCDRWSGWSSWREVPKLATSLSLSRSKAELTASYSAEAGTYDVIDIDRRVIGETKLTDFATVNRAHEDETSRSYVRGVVRGYEYRFRVRRCVDRARTDCGGTEDWSGWSPWKVVPKLATGLSLSRSKDRLTVSYKAEAASYDVIDIDRRPIGESVSSDFATVNRARKTETSRSHVRGVVRGYEYSFRVRRCVDSARNDCGGDEDWSDWSAWKVVPKLATSLGLSRSKDQLTVSYRAEAGTYDVIDIDRRVIGGTASGDFATVNRAYEDETSRSFVRGVVRGYEYRFRVRRCVDSNRNDCGGDEDWSDWSAWKVVPKLATNLTLSRLKRTLTATYSREGRSYDLIDMDARTIGTTGDGSAEADDDVTGTRFIRRNVDRGDEYRFRVRRCVDSARSEDCGGDDDWSGWSDWVPVPNLPSLAGKPTITVSDDDLTVTYTARGTAHDELLFQQSDSETSGFSNYTGGTLSGKKLSDVDRGKWYRVGVRRCTDSEFTDCTDLSEYSDPKYVAPAQVQATPTIGSGADGKSVIASFTLLSGFTYSLKLYASADGKRYDSRVGSETLDSTDTSHTFTGLIGGSGRRYLARLAACKSNNCTDYDSNNILLTKAPAPSISGITLANEDDLTVGYTLPTWNYGSGDVLDLKIRRSESATGNFATDYTHATTPSGMPYKFNDVHTGYYYKARARRCSDSALTICGDWSGLSSAVNVPALSELLPPSNIRVSIVSHKEIEASFVRSTRPSQTTHRYVFEVGKSASQTGSFTYSDGINVETATKVSFSGLDPDKWYKVRSKRCDDPARKRCGLWADSTNAVETVSPDPKIEYGGFSTSITIGEWLSKSIIVTAKGLDLTKTYTIKFRTATGTNSAAGVLKFAACDASTKPDGHDADVRTGSDTTGPLSLKVFGCEPGTDTLTVTLVEGVLVKSTVRLSVTVTPIPVPMDLRANGHSPGTVGQIELQWTAGAGVTKHEYQYADGLDDDGEPLADGDLGWSTEQELPSTRIITGRTLNKLYAVRLRSVRNGGVSAWSDKVYAFPTKKPLVINGIDYPAVADIRLRAFRTNRTFSYVFCANTITVPTGRPIEATALRTNWVADIKAGADSWAAAVKWRAPGSTGGDAYVRITGTVDDNCDLTKVPRKITRPEIRIARTKQELANACGFGLVEACIPGYPPPRDGGELGAFAATAPYIFFSGTPKYPWNPGSSDVKKGASTCSNVTHIAAHEFAHALGIGHRLWNQNDTDPSDDGSEDPTASITSSPAKYDYCGPQPLDIVAAMALYQSR